MSFSIETWHSRTETLDPATIQCVYRSWAWLGNTIQRVVKMSELDWVGFSIETWHSRAETLVPATIQCVYRSWAWLGNTIQRVVKMLELDWVGFSIETWHSRAETLDPATGQCVYRSWAWLGKTIQRARERWVVPDFETEVNGDSRSTFDRRPSLIGSLGSSWY